MKKTLSILLATAAVAASASARAAYTNYVHGDLCSTSNGPVLFDDVGATHNSTQSADFFCPVINANPTSLATATGRVAGWDGDSGQWAFTCTGVMRNYNSEVVMFTGDAGGPLTTGYTGPVNIPNPGNGTLAFPTAVTSNDSLVIKCSVPPRSTIYNVRVDK